MVCFLLVPAVLQMELIRLVVVLQADNVKREVLLAPLSSFQLINILIFDNSM